MAETFKFSVESDTRQAIKNVENFTKSVNDSVSNVSKSFLGLEKIATGALAFLGAKVTFGFFESLIKSGLEVEDSLTRLSASLKLAGGSIDTAPYRELAKEIKNLIGVDDELVLKQAAFLKSLGATGPQIDKIIKTSAQFSSVFGDDLETSVRKLTQAFSGDLPKGLAKYFTGLKTLTKEQLASGAAIDVIQKRLNGLAGEIQGSASVQLKVLGQNLHNVSETIGFVIVNNSFFRESLIQINSFIEQLNETLEHLTFKDLIEGITRFGVAILIFTKLPTIISAVSASVQFFTLNLQIAAARGVGSLELLSIGFKSLIPTINAAKIAINAFKIAATLGVSIIIDQLIQISFEATSVSNAFDLLGIRAKRALNGIALVVVELVILILNNFDKLSNLKFFKLIPGISSAIESLKKPLQSVASSLSKNLNEVNKELEKTKTSLSDLKESGGLKGFSKATQDARDLKKELEGLNKSLLTPREAIKSQADEQLQLLKDLVKAREITEKEAAEKSIKIEEDRINKIGKLNKEQFGDIGSLFKNREELAKLTPEQQGIAISFAGLSSLKDGAQGALKAFSAISGELLGEIFPGFGELIGGMIELLAQSPEKLKEQLNAFFESLPVILENIIANLDTILVSILEALAKALPRIIEVLATQAPFIAQRFSNALIANVPNIVRSFIVEFVRNIPAMALEMGKQAGQAIVDAVKGIVGIGGSGAGIGSIVAGPAGGIFGGIADIFGFAHGGLVPGGAPFSDRIPAMLTPGEVVIDRSLTSQLQDFLGGQSSQQTIMLQVGEKELASVMYDIGKKGFRT